MNIAGNGIVIKGRGKLRVIHLTPMRKNRQRIKRVETITPKGMAPKRYPLGCHGALTEWCTRCYTGKEKRETSAEQALKALLKRHARVNPRG